MSDLRWADPATRRDWLPVISRVTGVAAIVVGAAKVVNWALEFAMTEAVLAAVGGAEGWVAMMTSLWILRVAASAVVLAGLIAGWRLDRPVWARGVTPVALGMVVLWGWWTVDRYVDVWGWSRLTPEQLERTPADPELLRLGYLSTFGALAIDLLAVVLLVAGGLRLSQAGRALAEPGERPVPA